MGGAAAVKGEFMGFKAVIFDMDGVLIDSEYLYLTGIHRELQKKRPWVREEDLYPSVGMDSLKACGRWDLRRRWLPPPVWRGFGRC